MESGRGEKKYKPCRKRGDMSPADGRDSRAKGKNSSFSAESEEKKKKKKKRSGGGGRGRRGRSTSTHRSTSSSGADREELRASAPDEDREPNFRAPEVAGVMSDDECYFIFHPKMKPRDRLRRMTVKEARREKNIRKISSTHTLSSMVKSRDEGDYGNENQGDVDSERTLSVSSPDLTTNGLKPAASFGSEEKLGGDAQINSLDSSCPTAPAASGRSREQPRHPPEPRDEKKSRKARSSSSREDSQLKKSSKSSASKEGKSNKEELGRERRPAASARGGDRESGKNGNRKTFAEKEKKETTRNSREKGHRNSESPKTTYQESLSPKSRKALRSRSPRPSDSKDPAAPKEERSIVVKMSRSKSPNVSRSRSAHNPDSKKGLAKDKRSKSEEKPTKKIAMSVSADAECVAMLDDQLLVASSESKREDPAGGIRQRKNSFSLFLQLSKTPPPFSSSALTRRVAARDANMYQSIRESTSSMLQSRDASSDDANAKNSQKVDLLKKDSTATESSLSPLSPLSDSVFGYRSPRLFTSSASGSDTKTDSYELNKEPELRESSPPSSPFDDTSSDALPSPTSPLSSYSKYKRKFSPSRYRTKDSHDAALKLDNIPAPSPNVSATTSPATSVKASANKAVPTSGIPPKAGVAKAPTATTQVTIGVRTTTASAPKAANALPHVTINTPAAAAGDVPKGATALPQVTIGTPGTTAPLLKVNGSAAHKSSPRPLFNVPKLTVHLPGVSKHTQTEGSGVSVPTRSSSLRLASEAKEATLESHLRRVSDSGTYNSKRSEEDPEKLGKPLESKRPVRETPEGNGVAEIGNVGDKITPAPAETSIDIEKLFSETWECRAKEQPQRSKASEKPVESSNKVRKLKEIRLDISDINFKFDNLKDTSEERDDVSPFLKKVKSEPQLEYLDRVEKPSDPKKDDESEREKVKKIKKRSESVRIKSRKKVAEKKERVKSKKEKKSSVKMEKQKCPTPRDKQATKKGIEVETSVARATQTLLRNEHLEKLGIDFDEELIAADSNEDGGCREEEDKTTGALSLTTVVLLKQRLAKRRQRFANLNRDQDNDDEGNSGTDPQSNRLHRLLHPEGSVSIENETNLMKSLDVKETAIVGDIEGSALKKNYKHDPLAYGQPFPGDETYSMTSPVVKRLNQRRESKASRLRERRRKILSCCKKFIAFLFSHIGLCSLVVAYSIMGGFIFQAIEAPFERRIKGDIVALRVKTAVKINQWANELQLRKVSVENFTRKINETLKEFQVEVHEASKNNGYDGKDGEDESEKQWSFASSLLYAITVMTTIGYGHVAPKTNYGRVVTIFYAVLGIPLTLLCLTNIGNLMANGFRLLYGKVCCGLCCFMFRPRRRRVSDPEKAVTASEKSVEVDKPNEVVRVPTSLCILLIAAYIFAGALLFSLWESWDYLTGSYFCFITLSTIGFGDIVPGTDIKSWSQQEKLVLCALYLVMGLSLIAMCFNLVQEDVKAKCRWLGMKIGIIDKDDPNIG